MGLSVEDFHAAAARSGFPCGIRTILEEIDEDDRDVLRSVLADSKITHAAIERVLQSNGHRVKQLTIGRHRNGRCSCDAG